MATILLSAAGAAIGGAVGGTALGLTGAVIGRAVGATLGRSIDARLLGAGSGSEAVAHGRLDRFRFTAASEGGPIAQLQGRMRLGGQVIWATQFKEKRTKSGGGGGGKGAPAPPQTTTYSYSVSLAVALCEGEIARVGRIWADGVEIDQQAVALRVYRGTADQLPDPLMEAVEGAGEVPAYRGIAYVVFEDLELADFGNRVPQFAFEVVRRPRPVLPHVPAAAELLQSVALMPGTGEFALATSPVVYDGALGAGGAANLSAEGGLTDLAQSLSTLRATLPNLTSISVIYSWFGDDLRAGQCSVRPKIEDAGRKGKGMKWRAGGIGRSDAQEIAKDAEGRPVYGGTPADASVIEAIEAIHAGGQEVVFYPFLLMEILAGNGLPDPWGGAEQPAFPWRGRITSDPAPGQPGSPDGTAANTGAIDAFFGTARASDFSIDGTKITYSGPNEWTYTRFILHCAAICAAAGGVEAFCVGSEMRGLTQMRDDQGFRAVTHLRALAAEVRQLLPDAELSYAADWSEYFGYHPQDGSGDVYFHLDPLWADDEIDFIAIDNYMPAADWRDGTDHADAEAGFTTIHALEYLQANIEGGEGYDWYYPTSEARAAQRREPITDGAHGQDWVYRVKALRDWWANPHVDRKGGMIPEPLPIEGGVSFDGAFSDGGAYWVEGFVLNEADLPTAPSLVEARAEARHLTVPGEGAVIEVSDIYALMSERGWRPMVEGEVARVTLRTRLTAEPTNGQPHQQVLYIVGIAADGSYGGWADVGIWTGLTVADGWVERVAEFTPSARQGIGALQAGLKGWRILVGINGWTPHDPTGVVQQISQISVTLDGRSDPVPSPWVPRSKPIWFTEFGSAAIDKGPNQPNRFLDPKSVESALPYASNGRRDDLVQAQYLRAVLDYWSDPANNPVSELYGGPMLDVARAHAWAWDARPWPAFPADQARWSDGENWARGHWLNGRLDAAPLDLVVAEICERAGVWHYDVSDLHGLVRGHVTAQTDSARAQLQSLMLTHGFTAVERGGALVFRPLPPSAAAVIDADALAVDPETGGGLSRLRAPQAETVGRLRIGYASAEAGYAARVAEAVHPGDGSDLVEDAALPVALINAEAQALAERWLAEARVARDTLRLALPPSRRDLGAGDLFALPDGTTWRVDRVEDRGLRALEAVRVEPSTPEPSDAVEEAIAQTAFIPPLPVEGVFLDLPLLTGEEVPHAPHIAVAAEPWPGSVAVYSAPGADGFTLNTLVESGAVAGRLETPLFAASPGVWDRGAAFRVRIGTGALSAADALAVLNGANLAAIGSGPDAPWEVIQFTEATLIGEDLWEIGLRLRGQAGTDADMPAVWPEGSLFVLLDAAVGQVDLPASARGLLRHWRVGPARRAVDDASYTESVLAFSGIGLRPLSPVHLRAPRSGAGREIAWIRRTRVDGDSWEGLDVPLGEASESYLLRVSDAGGLRREAILSQPSFTYSDAMRSADGTAQSYSIEVAQLSDRVGPGPFARIEIHD